jgi:hypothetical protein
MGKEDEIGIDDIDLSKDASFSDFMDVAIGKSENTEEQPADEENIETSEDADEKDLPENDEMGEAEDEEQEKADQEDEDDSKEEEAEEDRPSEEEEQEEEQGEEQDEELDDYLTEEDLDLEEESEEDEKDAIIADLTSRLEKLEKGDKKEETAQEFTPAPLPDNIDDAIFGDISVEDAMEDKDKFKQVLVNAVEVGKNITSEHLLRRLPDIVLRQTQAYNAVIKTTNKFYGKNKDLKPFKKTVGAAMNEIHSENPEMPFEEVLQKAGAKVRKAIGLKRKAQQQKQTKNVNKGKKKTQKPAFVKKPKNKRTVKESTDKLADEVGDMINYTT